MVHTPGDHRLGPHTATMRAAVIDSFGPPETLRIADVPVPTPGEGEVLVQVRAAGLNAIDWLTRAGQGVPVSSFPAALGWDVSGTVTTLGAGVTALQEGDQVFGTLRFPELVGAYGEFVVAPATEFAAKPENIDHHTAAGTPMAALTAYQSVFDKGEIAAGQRVLIHGAAGGVGHLAVQFAKSVGAEVIGTASARNHEFLRGLGADRLIDYTTERVEDVVSDLDVVIDSRGGADFVRLLDVLRPDGLMVTLKGRDPDNEEIATGRGLRVRYAYVAPNGAELGEIAKYLADGRLRIEIEQVFALKDVAGAHALGEQGHVRGRLILDLA